MTGSSGSSNQSKIEAIILFTLSSQSPIQMRR